MFLRKSDQLDIPIELISANPDQPRKTFMDRELLELSDSIKEFGVIQPIIVKRDNKGLYILIAGERRLKAVSRTEKNTCYCSRRRRQRYRTSGLG